MEFQNTINKTINKKVLRPINFGLKHNVGKLKSEKKTKYPETVYLLEQSYITISNSEFLLRRGDITDSCSLLRSAFEYMMMGVNIQFNDNTFNEFSNLTLDEKERDETKPSHLITEYRKHMNELSKEIFKDMNREEKRKFLSELYDKMCYFTHGSLFVTSLINIKKDKVKQIYIKLEKINIYILKFLLLISIKYFTNDEKYNIESSNIYISYLFSVVNIVELIKNCSEDLSDLNRFLYLDKNEEYLNKSLDESKKISDLFTKQKEFMAEDKEDFINMLKSFFE